MFNKIGKFIRKIHRYLTPVFVIITVLYIFVLKTPLINVVQRVLMLIMAATGSYLFVQIYYNKHKSKKRKQMVKKL